jgi:hypothetical protein
MRYLNRNDLLEFTRKVHITISYDSGMYAGMLLRNLISSIHALEEISSRSVEEEAELEALSDVYNKIFFEKKYRWEDDHLIVETFDWRRRARENA